MIVLDMGTDASAYDIPALRELGVINDVVAGAEVAAVIDPADPQRWAVFSRRLDSTIVDLEIRDGRLFDTATGATFDPFTGGGNSGQSLDRLGAFTSYPADYRTFFPEAESGVRERCI